MAMTYPRKACDETSTGHFEGNRETRGNKEIASKKKDVIRQMEWEAHLMLNNGYVLSLYEYLPLKGVKFGWLKL